MEGDYLFFLITLLLALLVGMVILFMFSLGTMIGSCWIGMVSLLGSPACFQGFFLVLGLIGLLEHYFPTHGPRVVVCLLAFPDFCLCPLSRSW